MSENCGFVNCRLRIVRPQPENDELQHVPPSQPEEEAQPAGMLGDPPCNDERASERSSPALAPASGASQQVEAPRTPSRSCSKRARTPVRPSPTDRKAAVEVRTAALEAQVKELCAQAGVEYRAPPADELPAKAARRQDALRKQCERPRVSPTALEAQLEELCAHRYWFGEGHYRAAMIQR